MQELIVIVVVVNAKRREASDRPLAQRSEIVNRIYHHNHSEVGAHLGQTKQSRARETHLASPALSNF